MLHPRMSSIHIQTSTGIIRHWTVHNAYPFAHQVAHGSLIIGNFTVYQRMIIYTC